MRTVVASAGEFAAAESPPDTFALFDSGDVAFKFTFAVTVITG
jgi:hypothetical protein